MRAFDDNSWPAKVAAALLDDLLAAIASGIQWRFEINHSTVSV
jgi:hypothetical protein